MYFPPDMITTKTSLPIVFACLSLCKSTAVCTYDCPPITREPEERLCPNFEDAQGWFYVQNVGRRSLVEARRLALFVSRWTFRPCATAGVVYQAMGYYVTRSMQVV